MKTINLTTDKTSFGYSDLFPSKDDSDYRSKWLKADRELTIRGIPISDPDKDLRRRQEEHIDQVLKRRVGRAIDCMHNSCPNCLGTGIGKDGKSCVHMISCPCPRCSPHTF